MGIVLHMTTTGRGQQRANSQPAVYIHPPASLRATCTTLEGLLLDATLEGWPPTNVALLSRKKESN